MSARVIARAGSVQLFEGGGSVQNRDVRYKGSNAESVKRLQTRSCGARRTTLGQACDDPLVGECLDKLTRVFRTAPAEDISVLVGLTLLPYTLDTHPVSTLT